MTYSSRAREVGAAFDRSAERYDEAHDRGGPPMHALHVRMETALRFLGDGPGEVIDIGMGPGRLCERLAECGWTVAGVDPSAAMVARARSRVPTAALRLRQGCAEALDVPDASLDAAVATGVLEYIPDRSAVLAEITRALRPGGRAVLSIPNPRAAYARWLRYVIDPLANLVARTGVRRRPPRAHGARPLGRPEFERLLAGAGLRIEAVAYVNHLVLPPPLDALFPSVATRVAQGLEGTRPWFGRLLATQIVFATRRA